MLEIAHVIPNLILKPRDIVLATVAARPAFRALDLNTYVQPPLDGRIYVCSCILVFLRPRCQCMIMETTTFGKSTRKRDASETKRRILAAAKKCFAESGYAEVGVREIAGAAGVNNTLIARYFGSKAKLFEAALIDAIKIPPMDSGDRPIEETVLEAVMNQDLLETNMVLRSAANPEVREMIARITNEVVFPRLVERLGPPNADERALNWLILLNGYLLSTRLLPIGPGDNAHTRAWIVKSLQELASPG